MAHPKHIFEKKKAVVTAAVTAALTSPAGAVIIGGGELATVPEGFGFSYKGIAFDYGRVPEGEAFGDRHRFALGYYF